VCAHWWLIIERQITGVCAHQLRILSLSLSIEEIWSILNRQERKKFRVTSAMRKRALFFFFIVRMFVKYCRQCPSCLFVLFGFINIRYGFVQYKSESYNDRTLFDDQIYMRYGLKRKNKWNEFWNRKEEKELIVIQWNKIPRCRKISMISR
jgi:hypothetical protein